MRDWEAGPYIIRAPEREGVVYVAVCRSVVAGHRSGRAREEARASTDRGTQVRRKCPVGGRYAPAHVQQSTCW